MKLTENTILNDNLHLLEEQSKKKHLYEKISNFITNLIQDKNQFNPIKFILRNNDEEKNEKNVNVKNVM